MTGPGEGSDELPTDRSSETYVAVDSDWRITATQADGTTPIDGADPIGDTLWTAVPALEGTALADALRAAMADRTPVVESGYLSDADARYELRVAPTDDGLALFFTDVTGRIRSARRHEAALHTLRTLLDITTDPTLSFADKIERTLELGSEQLDLPYGFLSRIETTGDRDGRQIIVQSVGDHPLLQPDESCPLSEAYCRRTLDTDGLLAIQDALAAGWIDDPAYEVFDLGAYIGGKVVVDDDLFGTFCFAATDARAAPFTEADRMLVRVMAKWMSYELERRQSHEQLRRTNERLERFASAVSHDLRNPLTVAKGRLELARETHDDPDLQATAQALGRMETLIEESLLLAREGEAATDLEPVDLAAVADDAFDTVDTTDATLETDTGTVRADPDRLQRLLENLVRNAVDHAGPAVTITVGPIPDGFFVADDGEGIPPEERDAVFEHGFSTADGGTGYGLAIVEEIATAHQWDVAVTESDDGGARFEITGVDRG